jgi:hypothetical protein
LFLSLFFLACGESQDGRPRPEPVAAETDPCAASVGLSFQTIEDFEKERAVTWWVSDDQTPGSQMSPTPGTQSPAAAEIIGGRCGVSRFALHLTASDLQIWGGSAGYYFFSGPVDTTGWDGISFWARRGKTSSSRTMLLSVDDRYTDESHGRALSPDQKAYCFDQPLDLTEKCDRFVAAVGMEDQWRFFAIPFTRMQQRGFGKASPGLDRSALLGLEFNFGTGDWDVWIDDVAFYKKP